MSGECIYSVAAFLEKKEPEFPDIVSEKIEGCFKTPS